MALFDFLRRLFGAAPVPATEPATPRAEVPAEPAIATAADLSLTARERFWRTVGALEPDVFGHLAEPGSGPRWPTSRQAYRVVRRASGSVVVATDGFSDPFEEGGEANGYAIELFVETAGLPPELAGTPGDVDPLRRSWMVALLGQVAGIVAEAGGIAAELDRAGVLALEIPRISQTAAFHALPEHYVTADDALGILIGAPAPDFSGEIEGMPLSRTRAVPLVLLTAPELGEVRAGDNETCEAVAAALGRLGWNNLVHIERESLV